MNEGQGSCSMINGPFCAPLGSHTQSKLLYASLDGVRQNPDTNIKSIFVDKELHYQETIEGMLAKEIALKRKSNDTGSGDVGM
jgi:hypothetical protein